MATLAEKQAELARINTAIDAVRLGVSYSQGDRSLTRVDLPKLIDDRARVAREIRELEAAAGGARNPGVLTASWS